MSGAQACAPLVQLPRCPSTNLWVKQNPTALGALGAVFTTCQTAGRGRLGRPWVNAAGQALYYTLALDQPLAQPHTLPLLASLVVRDALAQRYGADCAVKWPNDLLLGGKKLVGILAESTPLPGRRLWLVGIGVNLAQPQSYFDAAGLPHGTSLALQGCPVNAPQDAPALAALLTQGFARQMPAFAQAGFAPLQARYRSACLNLGRQVRWALPGGGEGCGRAVDVDEEGRLVVQSPGGSTSLFTGEVSLAGVYGAV